MNALFIMNGIASVGGLPNISGGDVRWIEIAKCWQKEGCNIHVFTAGAGKKLCERLGLQANFHIFDVPNEYSLKTYISRFLKSGVIPNTLKGYEGIIYSTTENFYDVFPAMKIKEKNKDNIWAAAVHWVAPLKRKGTSGLNSLLFFFNQRMGFHCIKNGADLILAVSNNTKEQLKKFDFRQVIFSVEAGVDFLEVRETASKVEKKTYDAIFMKRFDGTKGVFDIIEIWKEVVKTKSEARLGMIGLGTENILKKLTRDVENYKIKENIDFLGPIYNFETKIFVLASGKLFVLPSYEENWGIVIGEAMAAGVPALCYDSCGIRPIWQDKVMWVPKGNKLAFAREVLSLLDDEKKILEISKRGIDFMKTRSWSKIAAREMSLILDHMSKI